MSFFKKHSLLSLLLIMTVFLFIFTDSDIPSTNSASRYLTIDSLVRYGSFAITENQENTDDKIFRDNNFYSSKPPFLSVVSAVLYYPMYYVAHLDLPTKPIIVDGFYSPAIYILNLLLVGSTFIMLLFYFYKSLLFFSVEESHKIYLTLGLAFGTLYLPYSTVFNNHTISGALLFISFYYLLKLKFKGFNKQDIFLSGLFVALSAVIDLPTGLAFFAGFFVYYIFKYKIKNILYFILPAIFLFSLHLYLNTKITGDIFPAQLHLEMWSINGYLWNPEINKNIFNHSFFIYTFNIFFGTHGLFFYSPILILSALGLYRILKNKNHTFFYEGLLFLIVFLLIYFFYATGSRAYGGAAYGFRWFLAFTPVFYFFIVFLFKEKFSNRLFDWFLFLLLLSFIINLVGLYRVWSPYYVYHIAGHDYLWPFLTNIKLILPNI